MRREGQAGTSRANHTVAQVQPTPRRGFSAALAGLAGENGSGRERSGRLRAPPAFLDSCIRNAPRHEKGVRATKVVKDPRCREHVTAPGRDANPPDVRSPAASKKHLYEWQGRPDAQWRALSLADRGLPDALIGNGRRCQELRKVGGRDPHRRSPAPSVEQPRDPVDHFTVHLPDHTKYPSNIRI